MKLTLEDIKTMLKAVDGGEQLEVSGGLGTNWVLFNQGTDLSISPFDPKFNWRIKPSFEVNGKLYTRAEALHLWNTSVAKKQGKGYMFTFGNMHLYGLHSEPLLEVGQDSKYMWQQDGVEMHCVNGVPIVEVSNDGDAYYLFVGGKDFYCKSHSDACKLSDAIRATITKQTI